ncbi:MAG: hypothetical protein ABJE10_02650 [bacterium]
MFAHSFVRKLLVPMAIAALVPLAAQAQESEIFTWSGRVDREVRLTVRGSQMSSSNEINMQNRGRFRAGALLPAQPGIVRVVMEAGRGQASVIQQPDAGNGYVTIINVVDGEGGADNYRVAAYFTPSNDGRYARDNRDRGVGRGRDDRGRDDRGRDDNRNNRRRDVAGFHWSGDVDGEVQLIWRNGNVSQRVMSGGPSRGTNVSMSGNPTNVLGPISLSLREGRGRVDVVQQPTADNRYTGIIRIVDPQRGYGHYDVDVLMR